MVKNPGQPGRPKRVLVTGHLGYVGAVTTRVLAAAGIRVTGCDIDLFSVADFPTAGEMLVPADIVEAEPRSDAEDAPLTKAPVRPKYAPPAGPRAPGSAIAVEKSLNFGPSLKRLLQFQNASAVSV